MITTSLELRTVPLIVIGALGTATVGVMVVTETVGGGTVATTGVLASTVVRAVAAGIEERIGNTELASTEIASKVAEALCRHSRLGVLGPVTTPLPGAPMRLGQSAARWRR